MFALQIAASCTLQQGKHQHLWCKTCPTLSFHVAFPMNSLLYVCTLPLLSIPASGVDVGWRRFFGGKVMPCPCCNQSVFYMSRLFVQRLFCFSCDKALLIVIYDFSVEPFNLGCFCLTESFIMHSPAPWRLWLSAHHWCITFTPTQGQENSLRRKSELSSCSQGRFWTYFFSPPPTKLQSSHPLRNT